VPLDFLRVVQEGATLFYTKGNRRDFLFTNSQGGCAVDDRSLKIGPVSDTLPISYVNVV
jgi:hypothetical protein